MCRARRGRCARRPAAAAGTDRGSSPPSTAPGTPAASACWALGPTLARSDATPPSTFTAADRSASGAQRQPRQDDSARPPLRPGTPRIGGAGGVHVASDGRGVRCGGTRPCSWWPARPPVWWRCPLVRRLPFAPSYSWEPARVDGGGFVTALAPSPVTTGLWLAARPTWAGVFRSADGGRTWTGRRREVSRTSTTGRSAP